VGYSTYFKGQVNVFPALSQEHINYLTNFADIRHVARNNEKIPLDERASFWDEAMQRRFLSQGKPEVEGEFYIDGEDDDSSVLDTNRPPKSQPGLWCGWVPSEDGKMIVHDGGEKFYYYVEWLQYICKTFLAPAGYLANGIVGWQGEEVGDVGRIDVVNNNVAACKVDILDK
jgi:hypothetical protein